MDTVKNTREPIRAPDPEGDRRLMELVAANDSNAQKILVHRLLPRVRRATRALLGDRSNADDATQLCLIEVLRSARTFRGVGSIEAWSDRIVIRTSIRHAKRSRARLQHVDAAADPESVSGGPSADAGLVAADLPRDLREYLDSLSPVRRQALILRHVLGHSIAEIAGLTEVSPNTVKDRLVSARLEIRRMVRRDHVVHPRAKRKTA
ncbi:MAG TPA: RNA polymerase sigma factor [Nannocystis exedens]|nr:RNA polymerase sigma factor [Nannocystis exedens]